MPVRFSASNQLCESGSCLGQSGRQRAPVLLPRVKAAERALLFGADFYVNVRVFLAAKFLPVNKFAIIKEFWDFLRERKKWWLAPIVIFLLVLGGLLVFAKGSALAPFIYSLF